MGKTPRQTTVVAVQSANAHDRERALIEKEFRVDMLFWVSTEPRIALRILKLVEEVLRTPFDGSGKPEALKHSRRGMWARRITDEHRVTYYFISDRICFTAGRYHYG